MAEYEGNARVLAIIAILAGVFICGCMSGADTTTTTLAPPKATLPPQTTLETPAKATPTTEAAGTPDSGSTNVISQGNAAPTTTQSAPTTTDASVPGGQFIAKTSDIPADSTFDFTYNGEKALLVNIGGSYSAFVNVCPHKGCSFSTLTDGTLICPCHGSKFNGNTGEHISGPAPTGLTVINLQIVGDGIYAK